MRPQLQAFAVLSVAVVVLLASASATIQCCALLVRRRKDTVHAPAPTVLQGLLVYDEIFDGRFSHTLQAAGGTQCDWITHTIMHHPKSGTTKLA